MLERLNRSHLTKLRKRLPKCIEEARVGVLALDELYTVHGLKTKMLCGRLFNLEELFNERKKP